MERIGTSSPQHAPWVHDIDIQTTKVLTTTGGTVWDAAKRAAKYLEAMQQQIGLQQPGVRVLELGAGCGFLGLLVARNLPHAAEVYLTEQAYGGALEHLTRNVQANKHLPSMEPVTTCSCGWTHFMDDQLVQQMRELGLLQQQQRQEQQQSAATASAATDTQQAYQQERQQTSSAAVQSTAIGQQQAVHAEGPSTEELADMQKLLATPWDFIIGSDLVYSTAGVKGLPRVAAALMHNHVSSAVAAGAASGSDSCCSCGSSNTCSGNNQRQQNSSSGTSCTCSCTCKPAIADVASQAQASKDDSQSCRLRHASDAHQQQRLHTPVFYYAHTKHRFDAFDVDLFDEFERLGLAVEEVIEDGEDLPPPSPPPFSSLYPEMRCAVFKITRNPAASCAAVEGCILCGSAVRLQD